MSFSPLPVSLYCLRSAGSCSYPPAPWRKHLAPQRNLGWWVPSGPPKWSWCMARYSPSGASQPWVAPELKVSRESLRGTVERFSERFNVHPAERQTGTGNLPHLKICSDININPETRCSEILWDLPRGSRAASVKRICYNMYRSGKKKKKTTCK